MRLRALRDRLWTNTNSSAPQPPRRPLPSDVHPNTRNLLPEKYELFVKRVRPHGHTYNHECPMCTRSHVGEWCRRRRRWQIAAGSKRDYTHTMTVTTTSAAHLRVVCARLSGSKGWPGGIRYLCACQHHHCVFCHRPSSRSRRPPVKCIYVLSGST